MKITFREAQDLGIWERIAELTGINPYAVAEGQLDENEVLEVNVS
jgi:hypothetical protein